MGKTIYIDCPMCEGLLEIDPESAQVVGKWKAGDRKKSSDDKLTDALSKIKADKEKRKTLFSSKKEELEGHKKRLQSTFEEQVKKAKEKGPGEKPLRPFDLD